MGKLKSNSKPPPKPKIILPPQQEFDCPFCNSSNSCAVAIDKNTRKGLIQCKRCRVSFATPVHDLYEPIDVYCAWIDACEESNALS